MGDLMKRQDCFLDTCQQPASSVMAPITQLGLVSHTFALLVILFHGILPALGNGYSQCFCVTWVHRQDGSLVKAPQLQISFL